MENDPTKKKSWSVDPAAIDKLLSLEKKLQLKASEGGYRGGRENSGSREREVEAGGEAGFIEGELPSFRCCYDSFLIPPNGSPSINYFIVYYHTIKIEVKIHSICNKTILYFYIRILFVSTQIIKMECMAQIKACSSAWHYHPQPPMAKENLE